MNGYRPIFGGYFEENSMAEDITLDIYTDFV
jgi:hypothetical protein